MFIFLHLLGVTEVEQEYMYEVMPHLLLFSLFS